MKKSVYLLSIAVLVSTYLLSISITSAHHCKVDCKVDSTIHALCERSPQGEGGGEDGPSSAPRVSSEDQDFLSPVCGDETSHPTPLFNLNAIPTEDADNDAAPALFSIFEKCLL